MSAEAWRRALAQDAATTTQPHEVMRVVIDVNLGERRGLVTASLREGRVFFVDDTGATSSALVDGARAWLETLVDGSPLTRSRDLPSELQASLAPRGNEVDVLREFALTFWRSGIAGAKRGALEDSLRQLRAGLSKASEARWLARFQQALHREDVPTLAHLLRGALARSPASHEARSDLRLAEVAREHLDAKAPRAIERRYLVDLHDGSVFAEERSAGGTASTGPLPRVLEVGLGELCAEVVPPAVIVQQYTLQAGLDEATAAQLEALALRDFTTLMDRADQAFHALAGFAEPVFLVAPAQWTRMHEGRPQLHVCDEAEVALAWSHQDASACLNLLDVLADRTPRWLVVRASPERGSHAFIPLACAYEEGSAWVVRRLRG